MSHLAWRAQPPDESADQPSEKPDEDAEVVDLTKQRLLGWLKGLFGTGTDEPPREER